MSEAKTPRIIRPQAGGQEMFVSSSADVVFFGGSLGGGKLTSLSSKVLTPKGWVRNGDLKVGDLICTPFSTPQPIKALYPQGVVDIYEFRTSDGRVTDCGLDHLWEVRTTKQVHKYRQHRDRRNFMILTTREIIERMNNGQPLFIQVPDAQEFEHKNLPIDPYLLGVLIGDGCLTPNSSARNRIVISTAEQDIVDRCAAIMQAERVTPSLHSYSKYFYTPQSEAIQDYLSSVGLNTYSYNKFIPQEYLFADIEQRRALLAGLFDTDGCVESKNRLSYSTTSKQLKDDFVHLCRSLGYVVKVKEDKRPKYTNCNVAYDISICTFDKIFTSEKHNRRYEENLRKCKWEYHRTNNHVRIESIKFIRREAAQCLYLDYPDHLYILDDFITTHNTAGAILASAEPAKDPLYRAVYFRRTLGELKGAGGVVDEFENLYGDAVTVTKSENPRITFKESGAWLECRQIADENPNKVRETYKGLQADAIFFEELTGFAFYTFNYLMSRARGKAKWTGKVRATTNPSKRHWVRKWCDWYIGTDGQAIEERSGVVRYFYLNGSTVDDLVWGDSKEEVYRKCRKSIDRKLASLKGTSTYENLIKSFTFIKGNLAENKELLKNNPDYVGSVSGDEGDALLMGSWDYDPEEENEAPIIASKARAITENDPCMNGDMWITADLADVGKDNTIILAWNGFHIIDYCIIPKTTGRGNYEGIRRMQLKYSVADSHVIYDGQRAMYMPDYIPEAIPYISGYAPRGLYRLNFQRLKDECYMRLVNAINEGYISMSEEVANATYQHQKIRVPISILTEFVDECSVVRFKEVMGGKKALLTKKEMNSQLGHEGSMDWLDAMHMRFLPCLACEYGQEIEYGVQKYEEDDYDEYAETANIYDDSAWC